LALCSIQVLLLVFAEPPGEMSSYFIDIPRRGT
jgi:hypothetical protein